MIIASTTYKSKGNGDHSIAKHLTVRFTGQLKGWWDNILLENDKTIILTAVRGDGTPNGTQNAVHVLVYAITKHFLGELTIF